MGEAPAAPPLARGDQPAIVGFTLEGSIDPPGRLESLIAMMIPSGSVFIPPPASEGSETPPGTIERLRQALERLGYLPTIAARPLGGDAASGIHLDIKVRAADRVRYIYVDGNWPLRQEEIIRRLGLRPGQALQPAGPERDRQIERERAGILSFLRDQGYLEAAVEIQIRDRDPRPGPVSLLIRIAHGPGYPIGPIAVQGNTAMSSQSIANALRHRDYRTLWFTRMPFRLSLLREDLDNLTTEYQELGYAGARLISDFDPTASIDSRRKEVRLKISVLERKRVEVAFEGNNRFDDSDLRKGLTLFERGSYDSYETDASAAGVAQVMRNKGHVFAGVRWRADSSAPDVHRIVFTVHEGPSLKVREVGFVGNQAFAGGFLSEVVTVRTFPLLGALGIGDGGYASFRQLELDVERLERFYAEAGYPDSTARCEIAPYPGRWQPLGTARESDPAWQNARSLHVRFIIREAPRIELAEVRFQASPGEQLPYSREFLMESLDAKVGEAYRPEVVGSDQARLRRLMGDAAYPQATVEPDPAREGNRVRLTWNITLGPRLRAGPFFLRGNFLTSERTIRRWMLFKTGDLLTTTALERSQRNLALIQLFNSASPISFPEETQVGDTLPVLIEVEERHDHWGVVRAGVGGSTDQNRGAGWLSLGLGGYLTAGYEHRNLFGQGWLLNTRGEWGTIKALVDSQFTDPRLFGTSFRLNVTGNYSGEWTPRLGDIRQGSGTIGFARELYPALDASVTYGWRRITNNEFLLRGAGPYAGDDRLRVATTTGSLSFSLEWQRLDNPLVPTRGFKLHGVVELALPELSFQVGTDSFVKTSLRALAVLPLTRRLSLRHSVRHDQGFPFRGGALLPKVERFFAGGDTTLRGFDLDRARAETTGADLVGGVAFVRYRPIGGSLRLLHNMDLQLHISGPWFGAIFADSGVVADSFDRLRPADFRHGAGIAPFMFRLPIGDISVAWAWPLDPQPGDPVRGRLHFNVGLMF